MTTLLLILWLLTAVLLICIAAVRPKRSSYSWFELKRRGNQDEIRREQLLDGIVSLRRVVMLLLAMIGGVIAVLLWQAVGLLAETILILAAMPLSRQQLVHRFSTKQYDKYEPLLLRFIERVPLIGWVGCEEKWKPHDPKIESQEQLLHLVETSGHILSEDQQAIIRNGLNWHTTRVQEVMIKPAAIKTIKHNELLGPLVLDDLHKTGHTRFPVIKGTLNTVLGFLDITELLEVNSGKTTQTAEQAMSPQVLKVSADESLPRALMLLQKSRAHMLIVIDEVGDTIGLLTLADITRSLLNK